MNYKRKAIECYEIDEDFLEFTVFASQNKANSFHCTFLVKINGVKKQLTCYFSKQIWAQNNFKDNLVINKPNSKGQYTKNIIKHSNLDLLKNAYLYVFDAKMTNGEYPKRKDGSEIKINFVLGLRDEYQVLSKHEDKVETKRNEQLSQ